MENKTLTATELAYEQGFVDGTPSSGKELAVPEEYVEKGNLRDEYLAGWMDKRRAYYWPEKSYPVPLEAYCEQGKLKTALEIVRYAYKRTNIPVLENMLVEVKGGKLSLLASDTDTTIRVRMHATVGHEGSTTIPLKDITDMVKLLPDEQVQLKSTHLEYKQKRGPVECEQLVMQCDSSTTAFKGIPAVEYPRSLWTEMEKPLYLHITPDDLLEMIEAVTFCSAGNDDSRPVLQGVYLEQAYETLMMTTADGFRLAHAVKYGKQVYDPFTALPMANSLDVVAKIIKKLKPEEMIHIYYEEGAPHLQVSMVANGLLIDVFLALILGRYADYDQIIPHSYKMTVCAPDRKALIEQVKRARVFSRKGNDTLHLTPDRERNRLVLFAKAVEAGSYEGEVVAVVDGQMESEGYALNAAYLMDFLNAIGEDALEMRLIDDAKPLILEGDRTERKHIQVTYLVMPMHLGR